MEFLYGKRNDTAA